MSNQAAPNLEVCQLLSSQQSVFCCPNFPSCVKTNCLIMATDPDFTSLICESAFICLDAKVACAFIFSYHSRLAQVLLVIAKSVDFREKIE